VELVFLRSNLKIHELTNDIAYRRPYDGLAEAVLDPYVNAIHVSLLREKKLNPIYAEQLTNSASAVRRFVRSLKTAR